MEKKWFVKQVSGANGVEIAFQIAGFANSYGLKPTEILPVGSQTSPGIVSTFFIYYAEKELPLK